MSALLSASVSPALALVILLVLSRSKRWRVRWRRVPLLLLGLEVGALLPWWLAIWAGGVSGLFAALFIIDRDDDDDDPPPRRREVKPVEEEEPRVQGVPALRPSFG